MAAANPLHPWVVLSRSVELTGLSVEQAQEWGEMSCPTRKAYGCGDHGQKLVEGLTLLARFIDCPNLTSYLRIRLNDQAFQIIQAEFGMGDKPLVKIGNGGMRASGAVHHAGDGVIVLALFFSLGYQRDRIYYLVYDATAGSLSMMGHVSPYFLSTLTPTALPVRREDGGVHLLLVARLSRPDFHNDLVHNDAVLCLCPPLSSSSSIGSSIGPWQLQKQFLPPKPFAWWHIAFWFKVQAFWADLARGVMCCGVDHSQEACFSFIPLPEEFQLQSDTLEIPVTNLPEPLEMPVTGLRTMGHIGDSLMFVSIGHSGASATGW